MNSMTGYGKASASDGKRHYELEIRTVNHRYLDIHINMPSALNFLENRIRKETEKVLARGRVNIYLKDLSDKEDSTITIEKAALKALLSQIADFSQEAREEGIPLNPVSPSIDKLLLLPGMTTSRDPEVDTEKAQALLTEVLRKALDQVNQMREAEGLRLRKNLEGKLKQLEEIREKISLREPDLIKEEKERMQERIKDLLQDPSILDEGRLENELAIYASKVAVDEELVRLKSHIVSMEKTMDSEKPIGKTLDFIAQEMNREMNTIGSKSNDEQIRSLVIMGKTNIEEIREQVQNVE